MQWGENQLQIIRHREGNLIVSAAAGAGKTSVLVERIVQMILDPEHAYRLDQMLIVTFTKAAAGQMKERIFPVSYTHLDVYKRQPIIRG